MSDGVIVEESDDDTTVEPLTPLEYLEIVVTEIEYLEQLTPEDRARFQTLEALKFLGYTTEGWRIENVSTTVDRFKLMYGVEDE